MLGPLLAAAVIASPTPAPAKTAMLTGKYESDWNRVPTVELVVAQKGDTLRAAVTMVLDHRGTRIATYDLKGKANAKGGNFSWKDTYGNAGVATLWQAAPGAWRLTSVIRKPADDGRWFEGTYELRRTAEKLDPAQVPDD